MSLFPVTVILFQHLSMSNGSIQVDASFMQTLWNVHPTCSGSSITEGLSFYLFRNVHTLDDTVLLFKKSKNQTNPLSEHQTKELNENKGNEHRRE